MPDFPSAQRGRLVGRGAGGEFDLDGSREARAAECERPAMLQVLADEPGFGTLVLLQLPPEGQRLTRYPVVVVDSGFPTPPAAQIGVQIFSDRGAFAFQGLDGEVEVYAFANTRISGRFAVTLRDIVTNMKARYAGVFESVPIEPLPAEQCARALEGAESPTVEWR